MSGVGSGVMRYSGYISFHCLGSVKMSGPMARASTRVATDLSQLKREFPGEMAMEGKPTPGKPPDQNISNGSFTPR